MHWMNVIAACVGYFVETVAVFGLCGSSAAWANDLIRRHSQDPYADYGWSRDIPHHNSMWDQLQAAEEAKVPDGPEGEV